jgi:hypothetical protein
VNFHHHHHHTPSPQAGPLPSRATANITAPPLFFVGRTVTTHLHHHHYLSKGLPLLLHSSVRCSCPFHPLFPYIPRSFYPGRFYVILPLVGRTMQQLAA